MLGHVTSRLLAIVLTVPALAAAAERVSEPYPNKSIRLVVPFEVGSTGDTVARSLAQRLSARFNQEVTVDTRTGAGAASGTALVARAKPDGYTATLGSMTTHVYAPLTRKAGYDPLTDFDPVTAVAIEPYVLALSAAVSAASLEDFIALAKARQGGMSYFAAPDWLSRAGIHMLKTVSGTTQVLRVSQQDSASLSGALLTGQVQALFASLPAALPHVASGAVRPVAVTTVQRTTGLPEVPTVAESGYPGFEVVDWYALFVPRGTPARVISRLHIASARTSTASDVESRMARSGLESRTSVSNIRVLQRIRADTRKYSPIVKTLGMQKQALGVSTDAAEAHTPQK